MIFLTVLLIILLMILWAILPPQLKLVVRYGFIILTIWLVYKFIRLLIEVAKKMGILRFLIMLILGTICLVLFLAMLILPNILITRLLF